MIEMPNACPAVKAGRRVIRIDEFSTTSRSSNRAAVPAWTCPGCLSACPDHFSPINRCKLLLVWQMTMGTDIPNTRFAVPAAGMVARVDMPSSLGDSFSTAVLAELWVFSRRSLMTALLSPWPLAMVIESACRSQEITE